jgi:hypothetical protein
MDELDYEKHLRDYRNVVGTESEYGEKQAQKFHALAVFNPLQDWCFKTANIAASLRTKTQNTDNHIECSSSERYSRVVYAM